MSKNKNQKCSECGTSMTSYGCESWMNLDSFELQCWWPLKMDHMEYKEPY